GRRDPRESRVELRDVAREFLAQGERYRVLQMRATDLHDVVELSRLDGERLSQRAHARHEPPGELERRGHVHRRRERVVGRLGHVDVVVGMDGALGAELAATRLELWVRYQL